MTTGAEMERLARAAAGKLTAAQRAFLSRDYWPRRGWSADMLSTGSEWAMLARLKAKGLLHDTEFESGIGHPMKLTPLGLAVRRILTERPKP